MLSFGSRFLKMPAITWLASAANYPRVFIETGTLSRLVISGMDAERMATPA